MNTLTPNTLYVSYFDDGVNLLVLTSPRATPSVMLYEDVDGLIHTLKGLGLEVIKVVNITGSQHEEQTGGTIGDGIHTLNEFIKWLKNEVNS